MNFLYIHAILVLFFFSSCSGITSNPVELNTEFDLKLGEQAVLTSQELVIAFDDVTEDSRCPEDVLCIWAGNASIKISTPGKSIPNINTSLDPKSISIEGFRITLITLSPYPNTKKPFKKEEYVARLLITQN